jgi:hypothetical protein
VREERVELCVGKAVRVLGVRLEPHQVDHVHDPKLQFGQVLTQDREEARRPGDGLLGGVERRGQHRFDVVVPFGGDDGGVGRLADDGQDRALDGLGDRLVRGLCAEVERMGEVEAVEAALAGQPCAIPAGSGW